MRILKAGSMADMLMFLRGEFKIHGYLSTSESWQGIKKERQFFQMDDVILETPIPQSLLELQEILQPNLPWADDHFMERIGGQPLNPGESYKTWPYYPHGKDENIKPSLFAHTYMERFWPKYAGMAEKYQELAHSDNPLDKSFASLKAQEGFPLKGIRYNYGDLDDVIKLLQREPHTRQAYLPIFFPEDTGAVEGMRVPCTLGYLFKVVGNTLNITYHIRSCDYIRHFRDDIYLAIRLLYHVLERLQDWHMDWDNVIPGNLIMHISNLHVFGLEKNKI